MVDIKLLNSEIMKSNKRTIELTAAMGVSLPTYYRLTSGKSEFTASKIQGLSDAIGLSKEKRNAIFWQIK